MFAVVTSFFLPQKLFLYVWHAVCFIFCVANKKVRNQLLKIEYGN